MSIVRGSSVAIAAKLLYWSAVMYNLHLSASGCEETDRELLTASRSPLSIDMNQIRCLYFSLLQCLLQVGEKHFLQKAVSWKNMWLSKSTWNLHWSVCKGREEHFGVMLQFSRQRVLNNNTLIGSCFLSFKAWVLRIVRDLRNPANLCYWNGKFIIIRGSVVNAVYVWRPWIWFTLRYLWLTNVIRQGIQAKLLQCSRKVQSYITDSHNWSLKWGMALNSLFVLMCR